MILLCLLVLTIDANAQKNTGRSTIFNKEHMNVSAHSRYNYMLDGHGLYNNVLDSYGSSLVGVQVGFDTSIRQQLVGQRL